VVLQWFPHATACNKRNQIDNLTDCHEAFNPTNVVFDNEDEDSKNSDINSRDLTNTNNKINGLASREKSTGSRDVYHKT